MPLVKAINDSELKRYEHKIEKIKLISTRKEVIKNVRNVYNFYGGVYLKQIQKHFFNHCFYWKGTPPLKILFTIFAKDFTVHRMACHQYATLPRVNSSKMLLRNLYNSLNKLINSKNKKK